MTESGKSDVYGSAKDVWGYLDDCSGILYFKGYRLFGPQEASGVPSSGTFSSSCSSRS